MSPWPFERDGSKTTFVHADHHDFILMPQLMA